MSALERRGLVLAYGVFGLFWGAWAAVLPAVERQVHASDGQLGLALAAIALSALPATAVAGRVADARGAGRLLKACLLAFGCAVPLAALASSLPMLIGLLVGLGLTTGALDVVVNTATAAWERAEDGRLMSVGHGAFSVGVLVGSAGAGLAREASVGTLPILLVVAACVAAVGLTQPAYRAVGGPAAARPGRRLPRALLVLGVLSAGAFLCEDALQSWSALQLERGLAASPAISGLGPGLFAGAMAVGRLSAGALGHRVRDGRLVAVAGSALAVGALVLAAAPTAPIALGGLLLAGLGTSVLAPVLFSAVGRRAAPGRQGADLSAVTAVGYAGFVTGPPLVGAISAASSLPIALGLLSVVGVMLAVATPVAVRDRASPPADQRLGS